MAFGAAPKTLTSPPSGVESVTGEAAIQLPESAQNQLPESEGINCQKAALSIARKDAKPIARTFAFELPESDETNCQKAPAITASIKVAGIFEKLKLAKRELPEDAQFSARNESRKRLWRIEKDGRGGYQWRLRFSRERISFPARTGDDVAAAIQARTGKGNTKETRAESERFRPEVERLEFVHRATKRRRRGSSDRKRRPASGNRSGKRKRV
jgi:hypothetical protein